MPFPQPGFFGERDRASPSPGPNQKGYPSPRPFVNRAASPVRAYALSARSAPSGTAWFLGAAPTLGYSPFRGPAPSPSGFPLTKRPPSRGLFRERGGVPCARFSTSRRGGLPGTACFFERSDRSPPFSLSCSPPVCPKTLAPVPWSFSVSRAAPSVLRSALSAVGGPPGAAGAFPPSDRRLFLPPSSPVPPCPPHRGPPRATKVQQLLIFGVPPSPGEAAQGGGGLLPTSVRQGGSARFSPDFRVLSQKMGQKGLARGCFPFFEGYFPTYYVHLAYFTPVIGNTSSRTPIFL